MPTAQPSSLPDPCAPLPCCIFSSCAPVRTTLHPFSCLAASHAEGQPLPSVVHSPAPGRPCSVDGHARERTERFSLLCFTRLRQFPSQLCLTPGVPRPHPIRGTCSRYSHIPTPPSTFSPGPRADPTLPTYSPARKTSSGLQEVTASSSLSSPDFSPCNSHLFPPLSLVSLFLCVCSLFLLISGSGILLSPVSDYLDFSLHLFILHSSFQVPLSALTSRLLSADPCHL